MPFLSPGHFMLILLLLVVVLIIWGPGKLPDLGAGMGRAIQNFKHATADDKDTVVHATETHSEKEVSPDGSTLTRTEVVETHR